MKNGLRVIFKKWCFEIFRYFLGSALLFSLSLYFPVGYDIVLAAQEPVSAAENSYIVELENVESDQVESAPKSDQSRQSSSNERSSNIAADKPDTGDLSEEESTADTSTYIQTNKNNFEVNRGGVVGINGVSLAELDFHQEAVQIEGSDDHYKANRGAVAGVNGIGIDGIGTLTFAGGGGFGGFGNGGNGGQGGNGRNGGDGGNGGNGGNGGRGLFNRFEGWGTHPLGSAVFSGGSGFSGFSNGGLGGNGGNGADAEDQDDDRDRRLDDEEGSPVGNQADKSQDQGEKSLASVSQSSQRQASEPTDMERADRDLERSTFNRTDGQDDNQNRLVLPANGGQGGNGGDGGSVSFGKDFPQTSVNVRDGQV